MKPAGRRLTTSQPEHLVAFIVRVSTDMQARNPEGSMKTQLQRLRSHLAFKQNQGNEAWREVMVFELRAIKGSESLHSDELQPLYEAIRAGRVNTVMFTALNRLCRSVKDFLGFVEFLEVHDANFISMKEDYDTTTAHGRLILTLLMALAEFEREQTAERTRDAFKARTERGLWNGSRLYGYDLDANRKGYLVPNQQEAAGVTFAFDSYLELGSISATVAALNGAGYRTRAYTSRREVEHPAREFQISTVQHMLSNVGYIAKKRVVDEDGEERLVDAVWPPIINPETFKNVQRLLAQNGRQKTNGVKPTRHAHVLSKGLLHCRRCGSRLTGRSGTGRGGTPYFYYRCEGDGCTMSVVASEIEGALLDRLSLLADDAGLVGELCRHANERRLREVPALEKRVRGQQRSLRAVKAQAAKLIADAGTAPSGRSFVDDELAKLDEQRRQIEASIADGEASVRHLQGTSVTPEEVRQGLANFRRVYEHLRPNERHEFVGLVLRRAEVGDREIVFELYEEACAALAQARKSGSRSERPDWLPDVDSNHEHRG
jgi:site-specific DNA recombinase